VVEIINQGLFIYLLLFWLFVFLKLLVKGETDNVTAGFAYLFVVIYFAIKVKEIAGGF